MGIRTPGGESIRKRAPAATTQPRWTNAATTPDSSGTGTQTLSPLAPCAAIPSAASAASSASRRAR